MTREEIYGYIGSTIFCLLVMLLLFVTVIKTTIKSGEEGILVNFGNVNLSTGTFEPRRGEPLRGEPQNESERPTVPVQQTVQTPAQQPVQRQVQQPANQPGTQNSSPPVLTQNLENTVAIEAARKEQEEKNRIEAEQRAQQAKAEAEQRARDAINQQVSGAFGSSETGPNQRGTGTTGTGIQGDPGSTTSAGSPTGTGYGEFNLGGRGLRGSGGLPLPDYSVQEEGRIVVNITVNSNGDVIFAEVGRGTNIDNSNMRRSALDAARKATFARINGANNQSGTITYRYFLK